MLKVDLSDSIEVFKGKISSDQLSRSTPGGICIQANVKCSAGKEETIPRLKKACEHMMEKAIEQLGGFDKVTFHPIQTLAYSGTEAKPCYLFAEVNEDSTHTGNYYIEFIIS